MTEKKEKKKKYTVAELLKKVEELEAINGESTIKFMDLFFEAEVCGVFLRNDPFIPEELSFETNEVRDADDVLLCRVYHKDGFSLSRYVDTSKPEWIIIKPGSEKEIELKIDSMEMGIKILQACGMDVSIAKYLNIKIEKLGQENEARKSKTPGSEEPGVDVEPNKSHEKTEV